MATLGLSFYTRTINMKRDVHGKAYFKVSFSSMYSITFLPSPLNFTYTHFQ